MELKAAGLRVSLRLPVPGASKPGVVSLAREFPIQVRRRGVEKRLLIPGTTALSGPIDRALLRAVARAHCWLDDLLAGRAASMTEIAAREHVTKHYVSRVVRLGLLAPTVVELIAQGRQPPELTAQSLLTGRQEVVLSWRAQKVAFGPVGQA